MSHFFQLTSLALLWRKLGQLWRWAQNWLTARRRPKKPLSEQRSLARQQGPNKFQPQPAQPNYRRRFMLNMGVGLGIILLAFLFRDTAFFKGIENEGIDTLMQIGRKSSPQIQRFPLLCG